MASTVIITNMTTSVVAAPVRLWMSDEVKRLSGSLSKVRLLRSPTQNGPIYKMQASRGERSKAGSVKRKANLQNAYAIYNTGKNVPNAMSSAGGGPWG